VDEYLSIVACDEEGVIRMFDYDPQGLSIIASCSFLYSCWRRSRIKEWTTTTMPFRISWSGRVSSIVDYCSQSEGGRYGHTSSKIDMRYKPLDAE
jgi:hypothetical protein